MPELHHSRIIREYFKHPKGYRAMLRNEKIGVITFAWDETPEVPHNPDVVICFTPFECTKEWLAFTTDRTISLEARNPSSMGFALGREVWDDLIDQGCWKRWDNREQENA